MPLRPKERPKPAAQKVGRKFDSGVLLRDAMERPLKGRLSPEFREQEEFRSPASPPRKTGGISSVGSVIRSIRKEKKISQEDLARKAGMDRTTVARIECGIFQSLSTGKLEGIAAVLGMDLKTLLFKAESVGETFTCRGDSNHFDLVLDYPEEGFRIVSLMPRKQEFFFGKIEIKPQKTVVSTKLPHPEQVYLHIIEGKILLTREAKEFLLKPGDCFAFSGLCAYEFYNSDPLKTASSLFITHPSFLTL